MLEFGSYSFSSYSEFFFIVFFVIWAVGKLVFQILKFLFIGGKRKARSAVGPSISVIVTSRNCEDQLRHNLPGILGQDYHDFEVVVVDDCSDDGTEVLVKGMSSEYPNLKYTMIRQNTDFSNALALTVGVRAASGEWVLFLSPECAVKNKSWLKRFSIYMKEGRDFVFGFVQYPAKPGLFSWIISHTNFLYYLLYGGLSLVNRILPYLPVNLAYRKSTFINKRGFAAQLKVRRFENELFCSKLSGKKNSFFIPDKFTTVEMQIKPGFGEWLNLRKRDLLLNRELSCGKRLLKQLEYCCYFFVNIFAALLVAVSELYLLVIAVWGLLLVIESLLIVITKVRLGIKTVALGILVKDIFLPFFDVIVWWNIYVGSRKKRWK